MKKYRIVKSHRGYEPQFKVLFFWLNFETLAETVIAFHLLEDCEDFIEKAIAADKKSVVVKEY